MANSEEGSGSYTKTSIENLAKRKPPGSNQAEFSMRWTLFHKNDG
jgi:hypothetical protein